MELFQFARLADLRLKVLERHKRCASRSGERQKIGIQRNSSHHSASHHGNFGSKRLYAQAGLHHDGADLAALLEKHGHRLLAACQTDENILQLERKVLRVMPGQLGAVSHAGDVRRASHGRAFGLDQFCAHAANFARQFGSRSRRSGHLDFHRLDLQRRLANRF